MSGEDLEKKVVIYIKENKQATVNDVSKILTITRNKSLTLLNKLCSSGKLSKEKSGRSNIYKLKSSSLSLVSIQWGFIVLIFFIAFLLLLNNSFLVLQNVIQLYQWGIFVFMVIAALAYLWALVKEQKTSAFFKAIVVATIALILSQLSVTPLLSPTMDMQIETDIALISNLNDLNSRSVTLIHNVTLDLRPPLYPINLFDMNCVVASSFSGILEHINFNKISSGIGSYNATEESKLKVCSSVSSLNSKTLKAEGTIWESYPNDTSVRSGICGWFYPGTFDSDKLETLIDNDASHVDFGAINAEDYPVYHTVGVKLTPRKADIIFTIYQSCSDIQSQAVPLMNGTRCILTVRDNLMENTSRYEYLWNLDEGTITYRPEFFAPPHTTRGVSYYSRLVFYQLNESECNWWNNIWDSLIR